MERVGFALACDDVGRDGGGQEGVVETLLEVVEFLGLTAVVIGQAVEVETAATEVEVGDGGCDTDVETIVCVGCGDGS